MAGLHSLVAGHLPWIPPKTGTVDAPSAQYQHYNLFTYFQVGRFSKLALLLFLGATTYLHIYQMIVPPSLAESHPLHFDFPVLSSDRKAGVPANASVDFSFQRSLMLRSGRRGIDWSSGQVFLESKCKWSSLDINLFGMTSGFWLFCRRRDYSVRIRIPNQRRSRNVHGVARSVRQRGLIAAPQRDWPPPASWP